MRWWWLHFGQTLRFCSRSVLYSTVSQAGHLIHRPSGTERRSLGSVCWIFGGRSFSNQLIRVLLVQRVERAADVGDEAGAGGSHILARLGFQQLDDGRA